MTTTTTATNISSAIMLRNLLIISKKNTYRKMYVALLFFILSPIILTQAQNGQNDPTFHAQDVDQPIRFMAIQSDEKIIIATGSINNFVNLNANTISRLKKDGKIDKSFNAGLVDGYINNLATQSDKKIVVAGNFIRYNGISTKKIVRLKPYGSLDYSFSSAIDTNISISKILMQPDGKILVGGFSNNNSTILQRLNPNGSLDATFNAFLPDTLTSFNIFHSIALQPDGKIIVAGWKLMFDDYGGDKHDIWFIRLNSNGTRDYSFDATLRTYYVNRCTINVESDGNILIAFGFYDNFGDGYIGTLIRLDSFGNTINTLNPEIEFHINAMLTQRDEKIIIAGYEQINDPQYGWYKKKLIRLNKDFTIDTTFKFIDNQLVDHTLVGINIQTAAFQGDKIIIGGDFSEITGIISHYIARINSDGSFDHSFNKITGCLTCKNLEPTEKSISSNTDLTINVYPNPANSEINVNNLVPGSVIRIYNSLGKEVYAEILTNNRSTIELSDYSNGIYFLISENNGVRTSTKFIVNKL